MARPKKTSARLAARRARQPTEPHDRLHDPRVLRAASDREVKRFYQEEKRDVSRARAEASRRGISVHARKSSEKKSPAQLDREIAQALRSGKKPRGEARRYIHELFYVSDDQQGGRHAEHVEQFDNLGDAVELLARLPQGSVTYGNASTGPQFTIVWAAPEQSDLLYWTDGDLNKQEAVRVQTREIRDKQAPPGHRSTLGRPFGASEEYFLDRFRRAMRG